MRNSRAKHSRKYRGIHKLLWRMLHPYARKPLFSIVSDARTRCRAAKTRRGLPIQWMQLPTFTGFETLLPAASLVYFAAQFLLMKALPMRVVGNYSLQGAAAATRELLTRKTPPDAIFCANDHMALAAINVARSEFNLVVGRDISIVGFDGTELAGWPMFGLTTYTQPIQTMVDCVVRIIKDTLLNRKMPSAQEVVPGQLLVRDSARIPKKGIALVNGLKIWSPM